MRKFILDNPISPQRKIANMVKLIYLSLITFVSGHIVTLVFLYLGQFFFYKMPVAMLPWQPDIKAC